MSFLAPIIPLRRQGKGSLLDNPTLYFEVHNVSGDPVKIYQRGVLWSISSFYIRKYLFFSEIFNKIERNVLLFPLFPFYSLSFWGSFNQNCGLNLQVTSLQFFSMTTVESNQLFETRYSFLYNNKDSQRG